MEETFVLEGAQIPFNFYFVTLQMCSQNSCVCTAMTALRSNGYL